MLLSICDVTWLNRERLIKSNELQRAGSINFDIETILQSDPTSYKINFWYKFNFFKF